MPKVTNRDLRKARDAVVDAAGGPTAVAKHVRVTQAAVSQWTRIPWQHVDALERLTGILRYDMRPDIYGRTSTDSAAGTAG